MNRSFPLSIAALLLLALNGSCSSPDRYYPVANIAPRQNSHGFSISPPSGAGWYEKHKGDSLLYLKKTGSSDHMVYMKATETSISPDLYRDIGFLEYVRSMKKSNLPVDRYKNITFQIEPCPSISPTCARYHYTYEDHSSGEKLEAVPVHVFNSGVVCMHPDSPEFGIDMYYSERIRPAPGLISSRTEGDSFLNSLRFSPYQ